MDLNILYRKLHLAYQKIGLLNQIVMCSIFDLSGISPYTVLMFRLPIYLFFRQNINKLINTR